MKYIENIIIGKPLVQWHELCCSDISESTLEQDQTYFTDERNLAKILKDVEVVKSVSEVRRNKPELCNEFTELDCFWIKWGKRRFWVVVGE